MPLPGGLSTFTLTFGTDWLVDGSDQAFPGMTGTLSVSPPIVDTATGESLIGDIDFVIGNDGTASIGPLVHNDDPGINQGTQYTVTWKALSYKKTPGVKTFVVPMASGSTVPYNSLRSVDGTTSAPYVLPLVTSVAGRSGAVTLAKADVGLSNVDNTADAAKPISTAQATALAGKANITDLGLPVAATVTAAGTLVAQKHNPADATSGPLTMTLPTGASAGTMLAAEKTDATVNAVTVSGNMRGTAGQSIPLITAHEVRVFVADAAGSWWPIADHRTKASLDNAYMRVYTPATYGAVDTTGVADSYAAVQAAITAAYAAGGGTVLLPAGTIKVASQLVVPNDGATPPKQSAIQIVGQGAGWSGRATPPTAGTILDLTATASTGKIQTSGLGLLSLRDVTLRDLSGGNTPFVYTTNTTIHTDHVVFVGSKTTTACDQDAIILGGTQPIEGGGGLTEGFQGYGTVISRCQFHNIRRAIYGRVYSNAVVVRDNTIWADCGNATGGAIEWDGNPAADASNPQTSGVVITGNLIEMVGYAYGVAIHRSNRMQVAFNQCYDKTATSVAAVLFDDAQYNLLIDGFNSPGLVGLAELGTSVGTTTRLASEQSVATRFPQPVYAYGPLAAIANGTPLLKGITGSGDVVSLGVTKSVNPNPEVFLQSTASSQVTDGVTTNGSLTVTSATAAFNSQHIGLPIAGTGIPSTTLIQSVESATSATMTKAATATATGVTLNFYSSVNAAVQEVGFARRHMRTKGAIGTATVNANAGTGGTASAAGTDMAWTLTLTTGTTPAAGAQVSVAAGTGWLNAAKLALTPKNAAAVGQTANAYLTNTISATVLNAVAPLAASTVYIWDIVGYE